MNKKFVKVFILLLLIGIFINFGQKVRFSEEGIYFDEEIMKRVHRNITSTVTNIMKGITFFGSYKFLIIIGFIILYFMIKNQNWRGIVILVLSTLGSFGMNSLLKSYYSRIRPLKYFLIEQGGYSFPSGHAMVSMTFYTTMTYLLSKKEDDSKKRILLWIFNFLIIALIGFSRIYLGVHWPTDVLGGYIIGAIFSYIILIGVENV